MHRTQPPFAKASGGTPSPKEAFVWQVRRLGLFYTTL
jgi:hypothetical protein